MLKRTSEASQRPRAHDLWGNVVGHGVLSCGKEETKGGEGRSLTVDLNYLKKSYKDSGTKLLVVADGKKKAEGMVTNCILGNSGRTQGDISS